MYKSRDPWMKSVANGWQHYFLNNEIQDHLLLYQIWLRFAWAIILFSFSPPFVHNLLDIHVGTGYSKTQKLGISKKKSYYITTKKIINKNKTSCNNLKVFNLILSYLSSLKSCDTTKFNCERVNFSKESWKQEFLLHLSEIFLKIAYFAKVNLPEDYYKN